MINLFNIYKYLDKNGLKHLFKRGLKFTFNGTQAEWDAMTDAEKNKYDIAHIASDNSTLYMATPIGVIQAYMGTTAPDGWLLCDGSTFDTTVYPKLYALLGKDTVPDLRECTVKGAGINSNGAAHVSTNGLTVGEFLDDQYENHAHVVMDSQSGTAAGYEMASGENAGIADRLVSGTGSRYWIASGNYKSGNMSVDSRSGETTEVKAIGVNFIICAK